MFNLTKTLALSIYLFFFTFNTFAQKGIDIVGSWRIDYEATVAMLSAEDKAQYTEESEKLLKPFMSIAKIVYHKSGKYENYSGKDKMSPDNATWKLKGNKLILTGLKDGSKEIEVKEASKTKLVLYDKNQLGFKSIVLVPAN